MQIQLIQDAYFQFLSTGSNLQIVLSLCLFIQWLFKAVAELKKINIRHFFQVVAVAASPQPCDCNLATLVSNLQLWCCSEGCHVITICDLPGQLLTSKVKEEASRKVTGSPVTSSHHLFLGGGEKSIVEYQIPGIIVCSTSCPTAAQSRLPESSACPPTPTYLRPPETCPSSLASIYSTLHSPAATIPPSTLCLRLLLREPA